MKELTIKNKNSKKIYQKLIITYIFVILGIVFAMEAYFIISIRREKRNWDLENNQAMCQKVVDYIEKIATVASDVQYALYQNKTQIQDVIWFLNLDIETYFQKKFEAYEKDNEFIYQGMDYFAKDVFRYSKNMTEIAFIGFDSKKMVIYDSNGAKQVKKYPHNFKKKEEVMIQIQDGKIYFFKEIYDPNTFQKVGFLRISFDNKGIADLEGKYGYSKILVYADNGDVAFGQEKKEWIDELTKTKDFSTWTRKHSIYIHRARMKDLNVIAYVKKIQTGKIPFFICVMLCFMGAFLFLIGMYFVNRRIRRLSNRLELIVNGMERVMEGDLSVRLSVKKEDELDIIADNFNVMCENLDAYIQKSYLAEIEQKNAEMNALQSQINPHFLYNTLEAIRMKAICNGDREVGKMLYGLAVVFRSQVKDENVVNVARELYYCKKYLEIFEFRYQNKFEFMIDCKEEYLEIPVIKFIVQPIIENYFAHGIRLQEENNKLEIIVKKKEEKLQEEILLIEIKDNGIGMTEDEIAEKKLELKEKVRTGESIGILNVHRRIVTTYGEQYGVDLKKNETQGLCVTLSIPVRKGESEHV